MIERLLDAERAMSFGQLDLAEEIYQQVTSSDPKNSIAVVGLARVTLERGDDLGAYLLARRALAIDPENDAARRMAVRLEEVLATRGQPVADPLPTEAAAPPPTDEPQDVPDPSHAPDAPADSAGAHIPTRVPQKRKRRSLIDRLRGR